MTKPIPTHNGLDLVLGVAAVESALGEVGQQALPGPGFLRQLTLLSRTTLHIDLPRRVERLARAVFTESCLPDIRKLVPWLKGEMVVG